MKKVIVALVAATLVFGSAGAAHAEKPKAYKNCTALNKVYPNGVGKKGAKDKTSGERVTWFEVDNKVYALNTKSDRDKDGIACEKA